VVVSGSITPATLSTASTVTLTQGTTTVATTTVDANGNYSFSIAANGTYTVAPSKTGVLFTPASRTVTVAGAGVTGANFSASLAISGSITPINLSVGSTVTLTQGATTVATTTVDATGSYTFSVAANGTYTVTPSRGGLSFTPPSQNVTLSGASVSGVNFTVVSNLAISGLVTPTTLSAGSTVTLTQGATTVATTTLDASGNYTFSAVPYGTFTVTPSNTGIAFVPASRSVTVSGTSVTGVNFTATLSISGSITPAAQSIGSTVTLTQGTTTVATTTADSNGNYGFTVSANGTYTVTPAKTGFSFTPASQNVTVSGTSVSGINFSIVDITPPTVSITAPAANTVTNGTIAVTASASDNVGVVGVQFLLDGVNLGTEVTTPPYSISWNTTTATQGTRNVSARARDAANNQTTSANVPVIVDRTTPSGSITAPAANATVSGTITVTASASASFGVPVASVQFLLDGANLGTAVTASPYSISWNTTTATSAAHTLTARVTDAAGNTFTTAGVTVTVSNGPPAPSSLTVTGTTTSSVSLRWTNNSLTYQGIFVERALGTSGNFSRIATLSGSSTTFTNTGLVTKTGYTYRIQSFTGSGTSSYSNSVLAVTQ